MKGFRIRSFSGLYFPAFGLNTEIYSVSLHIQFECGKIRARKTPKKDTFDVVNGKLSTKHIPYIILNRTFITFSIKALTFNMEF